MRRYRRLPPRRLRVGDVVEVSWAPPGHPVARWDATVVDTRSASAAARASAKPSPSNEVLVHYTWCADSWDEWLSECSRRIFPMGTVRGAAHLSHQPQLGAWVGFAVPQLNAFAGIASASSNDSVG